jgi:Leucine-rich repeat (LRR) protein
MKKLLSLIAIVLLATLAAQAATDYGFYVAGTMVTSDNCNNIVNNYIKSGTASYDHSTKTLTLTNITINTQGASGNARRAVQNDECSGLTVKFVGTCNLTGYDGAGVRIRKTTTLYAPSASTVVNIHSVNAEGIWSATSNEFSLYIKGPGTFNISSDTESAIQDEDDGSGIHLDVPHSVYFQNVNAVLSATADDVVEHIIVRVQAGSSVRIKATNNPNAACVYDSGLVLYGNETILEPSGAYYSNDQVLDANGNLVRYQDVYISDNYLAIINATNFPDAGFRNYLMQRFTKGYITQADVNGTYSMDLGNKSISNLQGIEYFTNLQTLYLNNNNLTSLSRLSGLSQLKTLLCNNNQLTALNLSYFRNLESLNCSNNRLTTLYANNFSGLKTLNCSYNTLLTELYCYDDNLTTLNVTGCTALTRLDGYRNHNLSTVTGLASCTALTFISMGDCALTDMSAVSGMTNLATLYVYNNRLATLDVHGKSKLQSLSVYNNPLLTELKCYSCNLNSLYVSGCTALKDLRCYYNANMTSLTGLDECTAMTYLDCEDCQIAELPGINSLTNFTALYARNNKLTSLTITGKSNLATLRVSGNTTLTTLSCYRNALTALVVAGCTGLKELRCYENDNLTAILGLAECKAITYLDCEDCKISDLSAVQSMEKIEELWARNNKLTTLEVTYKDYLTRLRVSGNTSLTKLDCNETVLTSLDVTNCTALTSLECYRTLLTTITGLGTCTALTYLRCENSHINDLSGLNNLTNLKTLYCFSNQLTSLNVQGLSKLELLSCGYNQLTSLNVQGCSSLNKIYCHRNQISGTGMTTLVNSLPTRTASNKGALYAITNTNEGNSMTAAQITTARNKYWLPYRYTGSAWVEMTAATPGDVNGDGKLAIDDLTALIAALMDGTAASNPAADVNGDNVVNIADVTALIALLMGN